MADTASTVDDDGVVRIGSVVFAMIRATPGHEQAFNRWYERDHYFTAGTAAPGVFSAGRFVEPTQGWHLALYFVLPAHDDARVAFATEQVARAGEEDRLFTEREHLHTWSYRVEATRPGDDGVPLALALDHRYPGLHVAMYDDPVPAIDGPALVLAPRARVMPSAWEGAIDPARRRTVLRFGVNAEPTQPTKPTQHTKPTDPPVVWSASFLPMVFGTDTHVTPTR